MAEYIDARELDMIERLMANGHRPSPAQVTAMIREIRRGWEAQGSLAALQPVPANIGMIDLSALNAAAANAQAQPVPQEAPVAHAIPHPGKPGRWICGHCSVDIFEGRGYACPYGHQGEPPEGRKGNDHGL